MPMMDRGGNEMKKTEKRHGKGEERGRRRKKKMTEPGGGW